MIGCNRPQPDCSPRIEALPREALVCPACSENARCVGGICACDSDFVGDGVACEAEVRGAPSETRLDGLIMALSADGNTLATLNDDFVSVQRREPSGWSAPVPVLDLSFFGYTTDRTLALNADGSVIAIGYPERAADYCRVRIRCTTTVSAAANHPCVIVNGPSSASSCCGSSRSRVAIQYFGASSM